MKQFIIVLVLITSFLSCDLELKNDRFTYKLYNDSDHAFTLYGYDSTGKKVFETSAKENQGIFFEKAKSGETGDAHPPWIYFNGSIAMKLVFDDGKIIEYSISDEFSLNILDINTYTENSKVLEYHFTEDDYQLAQ